MIILYVLLGLGIMFAIGAIWAFIEGKVGDAEIKKYEEQIKQQWEHRECKEQELYQSDADWRKKMISYKAHIEVVLNSISGGLYPKAYNAEMCLVNITPQLFVEHYQTVFSHVNWKNQDAAIMTIKKTLINDYPIIIVDDIIKLFYYIFKTEQHVDMLKLIVDFDKSSNTLLALSCSEEDIKVCIDEAKRLIRVAEMKSN